MERPRIMKTMKNKIIVILMAAAFALPAMAQWHATDKRDRSTDSPSAVFQSTSTMQTSGSAYSSSPTLNADGTAEPAAATAPGRPGNPKTALPPPPTEGDPTPVGDAVLPMMLLAMAYAAYATLRRRRKQIV